MAKQALLTKEKILPRWGDFSLKSSGDILDRKEGKTYKKNLLSDSDYQEIKKAFLSPLAGYAHEWKIEQEDGLRAFKEYELRYNSDLGRKTWQETGRKHWIDGFSETEKEEIEWRLSEQKEENTQYTKNSRKLKERILNNIADWGFSDSREQRHDWYSFRLFNKRNRYEKISRAQLSMWDYKEIWENLKDKPFLNDYKDCQELPPEEFCEFVLENPNFEKEGSPLSFYEISLSQQEKKILREPILDTNELVMNAYRVIREIKESNHRIEENLAKKDFSSGVILGIDLDSLERYKKNEKVNQAFTKNGISLDNETDKITKKITSKSKELKERVLNNLSEWCISSIEQWEPAGKFINVVNKNSEFEISQFYLTKQDRQQIIRSIIENIRQNKNEWKIRIRIVDRCACQGEGVWELKKVVNQSEKIYYSESGFTKEEWVEIEKILKDKIEVEDNSEQHKDCCSKKEEKLKFQKDNYNNLTQEELNKEIQKTKLEIKELKSNQNIGNSERQIEIQKRERKLAELESQVKVNDTEQNSRTSSNFPIGWVVGGVVLSSLILITLLLTKKRKN